MSRYSQLYIERGRPDADSERARIRLSAILARIVSENWYPILSAIQEEVGIKIPAGGDDAYKMKNVILTSSIRDLLDLITEVGKALQKPFYRSGSASEWLSESSRIFREENLAYHIDDDGIVHPFVA